MIFNNKLTFMIQNYTKYWQKIHNLFLTYLMMSTLTSQNLNLKLLLCMEKQKKRQIVLSVSWTNWYSCGDKLNQKIGVKFLKEITFFSWTLTCTTLLLVPKQMASWFHCNIQQECILLSCVCVNTQSMWTMDSGCSLRLVWLLPLYQEVLSLFLFI